MKLNYATCTTLWGAKSKGSMKPSGLEFGESEKIRNSVVMLDTSGNASEDKGSPLKIAHIQRFGSFYILNR